MRKNIINAAIDNIITIKLEKFIIELSNVI